MTQEHSTNLVLIVDDEHEVHRMLQDVLQKDGYEVITAENGQSGLEKFRQLSPHVVVLDIYMPVSDGFEFLKDLTEEEITEHSIIALTGHGTNEEIERLYQLGIKQFLRKPVNLYEFRGAIRRSFELVTTQNQLRAAYRRFTSMLANSPDLIVEIDENFQITYISPNVTDLLGYQEDKLLMKFLADYVDESAVLSMSYRMKKGMDEFVSDVRGLKLPIRNKAGDYVSFVLSANAIADEKGKNRSMICVIRDERDSREIQQHLDRLVEAMTVRINEQGRIVFVEQSALSYFPFAAVDEDDPADFFPMLSDQSTKPLFDFAFMQKEDIPFPVEVNIEDTTGKKRRFNIQFYYIEADNLLEGQLHPVDPQDQLSLFSKTVEKQQEALKNTVVIDPEMQSGILLDSQNLADEILTIIKSLEPYAYAEEDYFNLEQYEHFIRNRNVHYFLEQLRMLGNKVHGLKGNSGFLIPESKQLCHHLEEITKPLAKSELVLTQSVANLLKQFIFKVQEMLEQFQKDPESEQSLGEWGERIDKAIEKSRAYLGEQVEAFQQLIQKRSTDKGEVRSRKKEQYLSVSLEGYEGLSSQVKNLYYMLSQSLAEENLIQASNLYNEFLDSHQQIKKIPLDLSRYERLIPSIAQQYGKEAEFVYLDHSVKADREFWNALHEIFNHTLKNAVIHGVETVEERKQADKEQTGKVTVEVSEDALHIFVEVRDDGHGINIGKITEKAVSEGIVSKEKIAQMSESEILHLVFVQGVSTYESVDDNAGRGVGMNAVQEAMNRFQGKCLIQSKLGQGSSWYFEFPKSNVSLPCFIVTIGRFQLAIPAEYVDAFYGQHNLELCSMNNRNVYRYQDEVIPLIEASQFLDDQIVIDQEALIRVLILQIKEEKIGLHINEILHHATVPLLPLPEEYKHVNIYLGATFYGSDPVLVLNAHQMLALSASSTFLN